MNSLRRARLCRVISFEFSTASGSTGGVAFECALAARTPQDGATANASSAAYAPCASPATYANLGDGGYQFFVRAKGEDVAAARAFYRVTLQAWGIISGCLECSQMAGGPTFWGQPWSAATTIGIFWGTPAPFAVRINTC